MPMTNREFEIEIYIYYLLRIKDTYRLFGNTREAFITHMNMVLPNSNVNWSIMYTVFIDTRNFKPSRNYLVQYMRNHLGLQVKDICRVMNIGRTTYAHCMKQVVSDMYLQVKSVSDYSKAIPMWDKLKKEACLF